MPMSCALVALVIVLYTLLYRRNSNFNKKLWWVKAAPGYPLVGNGFDFADSTKSLNAMHKYLLKYDGLCYIRLLFRPVILVSDYKFLQFLLSSNNMFLKSREYRHLETWLEGGMLISDGAEWRKSRKILSPAFYFAILENFVVEFDDSTSVLIKLLGKEVDKNQVDIYPYISKFALDVICQTAMGVQLKIQEGYHNDFFMAVAGMCRIIIDRTFNPLKMIDFFYHLSFDYFREKKHVKLLHEVSNKVIETRRREIENQNETDEDHGIGLKRKMACLDVLLKYRDENGHPLSQDFIRHEVNTFMFAGHDTTASAISFALYCLANHPLVQEKALSEIKEVLGERDKMTYQDLQDMKYLELVVKETLRLYPSVPMYARETNQELIYDGDKTIPKGITLGVVAYTINRDPNVFDEPDKFIPTRFLDAQIKPYSYLPFSAGPRNCIGQKFAVLEMKSVLAKILLNFKLSPAIPEHNLVLAAEMVLTSKNGIKIKLEKRV